MSRIRVYFSLDSDRKKRQASVLVSESSTVDDAIKQLHDENKVKDFLNEQRVECVGIIPRSQLLEDDFLTPVLSHHTICESYRERDDIILVRRIIACVIDLCDSEDDSIDGDPLSEKEEADDEIFDQEVGKQKKNRQDTTSSNGSTSDEEDEHLPEKHRGQQTEPLWKKSVFAKASRPKNYRLRGKRISKSGYSIYYCLKGETPTSIAFKHSVPGGGERIVQDNKGIHHSLRDDTQLIMGLAIVLPPAGIDNSCSSEDSDSSFDEEGEDNTNKPVTSAAKAYQDKKKYGAIISKNALPQPGDPGSEPVSQQQYGRRVYTCLEDDTPRTIANMFGYNDPEELVYHNKGIHRGKKAAKLHVDAKLKSGSIFVLPLQLPRSSNEERGTASQGPRKRKTSTSSASAKKRAVTGLSKSALTQKERNKLFMREYSKELKIYGKRISADGLPSCRIESSNPAPFDKAEPGSFIPEEGRCDRRIYVCREGETPLDISREQVVFGPNPAGRIVFDNRARHKGMKANISMKQGDILVLPPVQLGAPSSSASRPGAPQHQLLLSRHHDEDEYAGAKPSSSPLRRGAPLLHPVTPDADDATPSSPPSCSGATPERSDQNEDNDTKPSSLPPSPNFPRRPDQDNSESSTAPPAQVPVKMEI